MLERTLALLASLAIDKNGSDDIMSLGGCAAMLDCLDNAISSKALESTAKAIARLAGNPRNVKDLVDCGAIALLVASLQNSYASSESKAQAIDALAKVSGSPGFTQSTVDAGAIEGVVAALAKDPGHSGLATASLKYLVTLVHAGFDMQPVADIDGSINAVVESMRGQPGNEGVQENGTVLLNGFATATGAVGNVPGSYPGFTRDQHVMAILVQPRACRRSHRDGQVH